MTAPVPIPTRSLTSCVLVAAALAVPLGAVAATDDQPFVLPAERLVAADIMSGTAYSVLPEATLIRGRVEFKIRLETGVESIVGVSQLEDRINEVAAVEALRAMKKTSIYTDSLKSGAMAPVRFGQALVTSPGETLSNAGKGLGSLFSDIGYSITSDDPDDEGAAKTALGFAAAQRNFAYELGVNPYSKYEPLETELAEVSWTAVGGSFTVSAGMRSVGGTTATVLTLSKTANGARQLVRDHSPRELQDMNIETLTGLGISESTATALVENTSFDPELETRFVTALSAMSGVAGLERLLERGILVGSRDDARFIVDWAELMAAFHDQVEPYTEILMVGAAPLGRIGAREVAAVLPADYQVATDAVLGRHRDAIAQIRALGLEPGRLVVAGPVEEGAVQPLVALGWTSVEGNARRTLLAAQ